MEPPPPLSVRGRHLPALDGVRALAILAVFAYHLGFSWVSGGYLGVDLFFVLSGFLITSLLVEEKVATGRIRLGSFWGRRARRLLPGLVVLLLVLGAFLALFGPGPLVDLHQVRQDAVATVLYIANWHQLFAHQSYFARYAAPSPLQHTWSLGIEEQFYFVWPFVVLAVLWAGRARWRWSGLVLALLGGAASAGWMAWLAVHGASYNRLYYGTDTRAFDLLAGAALAFAAVARPQPGAVGRRLLGLAAPAALVALLLFYWRAGGPSGTPNRAMFEWGFLLCALLAAVLLADVRQLQPSPLGRLFSLRPLQFVGRISYELYLWHWPVICELSKQRVGFGGLRLAGAQVVVAFSLAAASYFLIDQPLRRWAFRGWPMPFRLATVPAGMAAAALVVVAGTVPVVGAVPVARVAVSSKVPGAGHMVGGPIRLAAPPSRAHPLRVLLIGDSVMRADAPAVVAALQSTHEVVVDDASFDGWGLTTDKEWRRNVPAQIAADRAQLVICMWSFDDDFLRAHPALYHRWLSEFVRLVVSRPGVDGLMFQQFPILGPLLYVSPAVERKQASARNAANDAWNALARSLTKLVAGKVMYLPLGPAVTEKGRFTYWLPPRDRWSLPKRDWVRVRSLDGVHLCPAGAARYAAALLADLTTLYRLPAPSADWSTGSWTRDARYNSPPGNCPDDHPS